MKESDMYPPLKLYLEGLGYTVYPEIELNGGGPRADIVGVKDDRVTIIEMKTSFGLAVMEQADHWASGGYAHQTYIAIPMRKRWQVPVVAKRALSPAGIGVLQVDLSPNPNSEEDIDAHLEWFGGDEQTNQQIRNDMIVAREKFEQNRIITTVEAEDKPIAVESKIILGMLTPHHLNGPDGGGKAGGYISAHKITMIRAEEYLASVGDWVTPKQITESIETHYFAQDKAASLKQALLQWGTEFCEYQVINRRGMFRIKER